MKWFWVFVPLILVVGCRGTPGPSPTATTSAVEPTPESTPVKLPPTPTKVPPPPTPTPLPTEAIQEVMVTIPAGEFIMGSDFEDERPSHKVSLEAFEIDKFEVTNEEFEAFVAATAYQTEAEKAGEPQTWRTYAKDKPRHPVVKVTWNDAVAYCEWTGKRLPTEAEWEKAARGTEGYIYPWGNEWDPTKANTKESGHRDTTIVGSFPEGVSPYGVMDMVGNVREWTSDWYKAYPGSDFQSPYFGQKFRVIRGGGWFDPKELARTAKRYASSPEARNDDLGFRCAH